MPITDTEQPYVGTQIDQAFVGGDVIERERRVQNRRWARGNLRQAAETALAGGMERRRFLLMAAEEYDRRVRDVEGDEEE